MQDVFLYRGTDPPHGICRQPEATVGVEAADRLHHPDIAFADQFTHRQAIATIAHGDLGDETQVGSDEFMRGLGVALVLPAARQTKLLLGESMGNLRISKVFGQVVFGTGNKSRSRRGHCNGLLFQRDGAALIRTNVTVTGRVASSTLLDARLDISRPCIDPVMGSFIQDVQLAWGRRPRRTITEHRHAARLCQ